MKSYHHTCVIFYFPTQKFLYRHYPKIFYHVKQAKTPYYTFSNNPQATQSKSSPDGLSARPESASQVQTKAVLQAKHVFFPHHSNPAITNSHIPQ